MKDQITKNTRLVFFVFTLLALVAIHRWLTGNWYPAESSTSFVFQNLILMVVLGSLIVEPNFTKPSDALVNSLAVLITLASVKDRTTYILWGVNSGYALAVFVFSLIAIILGQKEESATSARNKAARFFYSFAIFFGKSNLIFSVTFLLSVFSFFNTQQKDFIVLMCFWAFLIVAKPIGFLSLLQRLGIKEKQTDHKQIGEVISVTLPGSFRIRPFNDVTLSQGDWLVFKREEGAYLAVVTENYALNQDKIAQASIIKSLSSKERAELTTDGVFRISSEDLSRMITDETFVKKADRFIGVVVENSSIGEIAFKVISRVPIEEGYILEALINGQSVLYQIVNAKTGVEQLSPDLKSGLIIGTAQQVGIWNNEKVRFDKFGWVPAIHTPLYLIDKSYKLDCGLKPSEIILGYIPNTNFPIIANVDTLITHHTAILGITGSGKTEMAFTIIQKMAGLKAKVFCVDFTGDYLAEFESLNPQKLAISSEHAKSLNEKLLAVETGQYGAGKEIGELEKFKSVLIPEIKKMVEEFIKSDKNLAIFELSDIVNTSATIAITEFYLSQIFAYARQNRDRQQKFCIVLEEAHTVIPESQTMGVQDKYSKATISKISQIALQGRKYDVGLMVIAQRTANVTKTVLNQCNSVIVFNSYDKTGFDFLENYVGPSMISAIPNLKWLQGMVVGRGFKSGRPLIMEIPFKSKFQEKQD